MNLPSIVLSHYENRVARLHADLLGFNAPTEGRPTEEDKLIAQGVKEAEYFVETARDLWNLDNSPEDFAPRKGAVAITGWISTELVRC